jgi:hypothetical protein
MTSTQPTLQWSETEPAAAVLTGEQLDQLIDRIAAGARSDFPISVRLQVHGCEVDILLGLPESFVYVNEVTPRREFITVGDLYIDGGVSFYLLGQHHTEFERRHLIPVATARRVLREFFDTGRRSASVEWEESWY